MGQTTHQQREEWLAEFQALAAQWGGQCLSDEYVNQRTQLTFKCAEGHTWSALPMNVYHKGSWCPHCSGNAKLTLKHVQQAAAALGCTCLSDTYVSVHEPLEFECSAGHRFTASTTSVRTMQSACMECQKLTIEEFQSLCDSINYTLLSTEYVNNYTPLRLICDYGHRFDMQPKHLKEGKRCTDCRAGRLQNDSRRARRFSYR